MSLPIYVTTCDAYCHLVPKFAELFNTYWDDTREVMVFGFQKDPGSLPDNFTFISLGEDTGGWSGQMMKILKEYPAKHFIRLSEEFFLEERVDQERLAELEALAEEEEVYRVSLQCVEDGYEKCAKQLTEDLYQLSFHAEYLSSLEASIYDGEKLLAYLEPDFHIWKTEIPLSRVAERHKERVLVPKERVLVYKDAMRRGESRHPEFKDIV